MILVQFENRLCYGTVDNIPPFVPSSLSCQKVDEPNGVLLLI